MKQLNANYAIYFNKKYRCSGHLWQGRFKSWYVTDEAYLYTLMLYIEQNPLKAKIIERLEEYRYSSYHYFLDVQNIPECLKESWIVQNFQHDREAISVFLNAVVDFPMLQELKKASSLVEAPNVDKKPDIEKLSKMLLEAKDTKERNIQIFEAYKQGYFQHRIAKILGLAQPTVNAIVKRMKGDSTITITSYNTNVAF